VARPGEGNIPGVRLTKELKIGYATLKRLLEVDDGCKS